MPDLKHPPLETIHLEHGAKMVPFAGWNMPVQYSSILAEHHAVRNQAGIFDISHMGQLRVTGPMAETWLNHLLTNNVAKLTPGKGQYTLMLNESGGVIDDLIIYRMGPESYFLVVNASMKDADLAWMRTHFVDGVSLEDESDSRAGLAVQGPLAAKIFSEVCPSEPLPPRNGIIETSEKSIVCRTGYTGEDGFEFFCPVATAATWWNRFIHAGATPCGLGARDTLRLEMGYPLNGNDLTPHHSPFEAGLGRFCDTAKPEFIGREEIIRQKTDDPGLRLTAIRCTGKTPPLRAHYPVAGLDGRQISELTSGALSPSLNIGIGLAYLPDEYSPPGTAVQIEIRGRFYPAETVTKPFYKKHSKPAHEHSIRPSLPSVS